MTTSVSIAESVQNEAELFGYAETGAPLFLRALAVRCRNRAIECFVPDRGLGDSRPGRYNDRPNGRQLFRGSPEWAELS